MSFLEIESNSIDSVLTLQIHQAIRSSIQTSLLCIKDKWSQSVKFVDFSIKYPTDSQGFSGEVGLPSLADLNIKPLNISDPFKNLSSLGTNYGSILGNKSPTIKNVYDTVQKLKITHTGYNRFQNKRGLQRIVQSYQKPKKKNVNPMNWKPKDVFSLESITPYAQVTFTDLLLNNLNGIR